MSKEKGVNKTWGRGRSGSFFCFKECYFKVRVKVRLRINVNPKPKTTFFKRKIDPDPEATPTPTPPRVLLTVGKEIGDA